MLGALHSLRPRGYPMRGDGSFERVALEGMRREGWEGYELQMISLGKPVQSGESPTEDWGTEEHDNETGEH